MKKKKDLALSNTKIVIVFFAFLVFFVSLSLVFKMVLVVRAGQFDDSRRFNLSISNNKDTQVLSLSPNPKSISIIKLDKKISFNRVGQFLEIPIDATIASNSLDLNQEVNSLFLNLILNYKNLQTNLTIIDLLKLLFFARTVPEHQIITKNIPQDLSGADTDRILSRLFSDELIEKDNQTIQIINATEIGGFGNRLARLVTNMGGDVIIVASANSTRKESLISYIDKKTYTVEKLIKILGYRAIKMSDNAISDITITIGEDKVSSSPF